MVVEVALKVTMPMRVDLVVVVDMVGPVVAPINQVFQYLVHIQEPIMDLLVRHT